MRIIVYMVVDQLLNSLQPIKDITEGGRAWEYVLYPVIGELTQYCSQCCSNQSDFSSMLTHYAHTLSPSCSETMPTLFLLHAHKLCPQSFSSMLKNYAHSLSPPCSQTMPTLFLLLFFRSIGSCIHAENRSVTKWQTLLSTYFSFSSIVLAKGTASINGGGVGNQTEQDFVVLLFLRRLTGHCITLEQSRIISPLCEQFLFVLRLLSDGWLVSFSYPKHNGLKVLLALKNAFCN